MGPVSHVPFAELPETLPQIQEEEEAERAAAEHRAALERQEREQVALQAMDEQLVRAMREGGAAASQSAYEQE